MMMKPTPAGGREVRYETPFGSLHIKAAEAFGQIPLVVNGRTVGHVSFAFSEPSPEAPAASLPPQRIPKDYNPAHERQGCCDPPADIGNRQR